MGFKIWSLEIKSGNSCVAIMTNFLDNFQKLLTFWSLNFPTIKNWSLVKKFKNHCCRPYQIEIVDQKSSLVPPLPASPHSPYYGQIKVKENSIIIVKQFNMCYQPQSGFTQSKTATFVRHVKFEVGPFTTIPMIIVKLQFKLIDAA